MTAPRGAVAGQGTAMLLVLLGGMLGAPARYAVDTLLPGVPDGFPWSTFTVNVAGAFALGLLLESLVRSGEDRGGRRRLRLLIGTGFLGAFTTYSSFAVQLVLLAHDGRVGMAFGYAAASLATGLAAVAAGVFLAGRPRSRGVVRAADGARIGDEVRR